MAYFSNGNEEMRYQGEWCDRCIHWRESEPGNEDWGCPVMDLHIMGNYDQCKDTSKGRLWKKVLEHFIPTGKNLFAKQCMMFLEKLNADLPGQMKLFEKPK